MKEVTEVPAINIGYHGLALKIAGHHDLRLDFRSKDSHAEVSPAVRDGLLISRQ